MIPITTNAINVELAGKEVHIRFPAKSPYFWLKNLGNSTVRMSLSPNISEGGDGVIEVSAGSSAGTMQGYNNLKMDLYILGSGKVQIMSTEAPNNPFDNDAKGGEGNVNIKLGGLVEHITGSSGWKIDVNGSSTSKNASEHCITYYKVAEGLTIYVKAEDNNNDCKFIWSKSEKADVTSSYPNPSLIGTPVTDVVNGIVIVPEGAHYICFSKHISDTETGVYTLLS